MLCTWFHPARLRFPCHAQPKLNGFRAVYKDGRIFSRNGYSWHEGLLDHIVEPIKRAIGAKAILDGELYCHGWPLERIADALSFQRTGPSVDTLQIAFYVFDVVCNGSFAGRAAVYHSLVCQIAWDHVQAVPAIEAEDLETADALHKLNLQSGFEGTIYRLGDSGYRPGRSTCLMKRKEFRGSGFKEPKEFGARKNNW